MTVKLCVDWSGMVLYLPMEVRIWLLPELWMVNSDPRLHDLQPSCSWASLLCILVFLWITKFITAPPPPFRPGPLKPFIIVFILQLTEKEKQLQEERKKLMEMKKLEEQEKARIKAQVIILTIFYKVENTYLLKKWWIFNFLNYQVFLEDIVLLLVYHQV